MNKIGDHAKKKNFKIYLIMKSILFFAVETFEEVCFVVLWIDGLWGSQWQKKRSVNEKAGTEILAYRNHYSTQHR